MRNGKLNACWAAWLVLSCWLSPAAAHELDFDQLRLFWDDASGEL